jgi:AraC-like DNA-binding protein
LVDLPGLSHVVWFEEIHIALAPAVARELQADILACLATAIETASGLPQELRRGLALACSMPRPPRTVAGLCRALGIEEGHLRYLWRRNMAGASSLREFVDWLLLGVALRLRPMEGSWAAVADRLGLSEETLRNIFIRRTGHRPGQLAGTDPGIVRGWSAEWWAKARAG